MIPGCEAKLKEAAGPKNAKNPDGLANIANTHENFKKLIELYGQIFHDFIEDDPLAASPLTKLHIKKADLDKARDGDPVKKTNGIKTAIDSAKQIGCGGDVTADYMNELAQNNLNHGATDENSAKNKAKVTKLDKDDASELYVDAAMWYFRAALCYYTGGGLSAGKFPPAGAPGSAAAQAYQAYGQAMLNYAAALNKAAQMLLEAAGNEDQDKDFAEIIAENLVANLLFTDAKAAFDALSKAGFGGPPVTDGAKAADTGATQTGDNLTTYQK